jgi:amino acid transporter
MGAEVRSPTPFVRSLGLREALAVNMTQMCGIGPFVTIPLMVAAVGGPQAIVGWVVGALLALADGLVWAELGAAMPGSGGTYIYLREAFQYRTGRLMPFFSSGRRSSAFRWSCRRVSSGWCNTSDIIFQI